MASSGAHLLEAGRDGVELGAVGAVGAVAAQAPVAHAVGGQEVARPRVAPAAERHIALVLKDLLIHLVCAGDMLSLVRWALHGQKDSRICTVGLL